MFVKEGIEIRASKIGRMSIIAPVRKYFDGRHEHGCSMKELG